MHWSPVSVKSFWWKVAGVELLGSANRIQQMFGGVKERTEQKADQLLLCSLIFPLMFDVFCRCFLLHTSKIPEILLRLVAFCGK